MHGMSTGRGLNSKLGIETEREKTNTLESEELKKSFRVFFCQIPSEVNYLCTRTYLRCTYIYTVQKEDFISYSRAYADRQTDRQTHQIFLMGCLELS